MRTSFLACLALLAVLHGAAARAEEPPAPRLDRIDYANPTAYLASGDAVEAGQRTQSIARQLRGQDARATLANIARWLGRNLRRDESKARTWRGVDQILAEGTRGGETDLALVNGVLARAAGIPCVWVKTVPADWVPRFQAGAASLEAGVDRVFLEVAVDGRWHLLDPVEARLYEAYDTRSRLLPGNRLAYDKGADPHGLVLPSRWAAWSGQTRAWFSKLDLSAVPWADATDLLAPWTVYITGRGGPAAYARAACRTLGFNVEKTFNSGFERVLPLVRGKTLIVTCHGRTPNLPKALWDAWLPPGYREFVSGGGTPEKGWIAHRLADGTRVVLVTATDFGPVELAVSEALEG